MLQADRVQKIRRLSEASGSFFQQGYLQKQRVCAAPCQLLFFRWLVFLKRFPAKRAAEPGARRREERKQMAFLERTLRGTTQLFAAGMAAGMPVVLVISAAVFATNVSFAMMAVVMAAPGGGIELQRAGKQGGNRCVRVARYAAVKSDFRLIERLTGAAANAAADQRINLMGREEGGQRAVAAAVGGDDFVGCNGAVFRGVELKLFCVTKVLVDLAVFIRDCDFHQKEPPVE